MTWWRLRSLRSRLACLVLLTLAPAVILHIVSFHDKRRLALEATQDNLTDITRLAAEHAGTLLQNAREVVYGLTKLPEIANMDAVSANRAFRQAQEIFPQFASLSLISPDGTILATTTAPSENGGSTDLTWTRLALATHSLAVGGQRTGPDGAISELILAQPVFDTTGTVRGVCQIALRLDWFAHIFMQSSMPEQAEAELFDSHGFVLAGWPHKPSRIGATLENTEALISRLGDADETNWRAPGPDGTPFFFVIARPQSKAADRLAIRLQLPLSAITEPLEARQDRDMLILGLTIALALVAAHFGSNAFVLRPVKRLALMATAMAGGDLDQRSGMGGSHGEIAELGHAFDTMADALRERIRFTQEIIDAIPTPLFYKDADGRFLGCNKAYEQAVAPASTILGNTSAEIHPPAQAEQCRRTDLQALAAPGRTIEYETQVTFRDGSAHDAIVFKSLFNTVSGEPAGIVGVAIDITARKRSQQALQASQAKYAALVASMRDGLVIIDPKGRLVESNRAFQEMLGYTAEELSRLTYQDITPAAWHEADAALLRTDVEADGFSTLFEKEYRRKDGTVFPAALRMHHYPARSGNGLRYFAIVRDITDIKASEADLRAAKEAAEAANQAKSNFLAKMSHEIRTPLHAIIGLTELTLGTKLSDQQRDALETVKESAGNLFAIINDILDFSRMEAGKLELVQESFDLRRTLATIMRPLRSEIRGKDLFLRLRIAPTIPRFVRGDALRLRQILVNLIGNALKFTLRGGVTVTIRPDESAVETPGSLPRIAFTVADTGIGISEEHLAGIFEMFTQADATVSCKYGGTGLGLAICRELCRLMRGDISVASIQGRGSAFCVKLPMAPGEPPTNQVLEPKTAQPQPQGPNRLRILLAEDNAINIKVAITYLNRHGHQTVVTEDGVKALDALTKSCFDLVLMDMEMPEMDGLECTRRLRAGAAGEHNKAIPVVAMTAHALSGARDRCLAAGMTGYLSKPLDFAALETLLAEVTPNTAPSPSQSNTKAPATPPSLDTPRALARLGDDVELLRELQADFLRQYPLKLRQIALSCEHENWEEAALTAHSLKNIAGAIGAEKGRLLCGRLEDLLRRGDDLAASELLEALRQSLAEAGNAINASSRVASPHAAEDATTSAPVR